MEKINLVSLSSEQLWPTIHCLAHYGDKVEKLFLLHTNDKYKSIQPAFSIGKFVNLWNPKIDVIMPKVAPENSSADISKALHEWMEDYPDCKWVINASGGTKLMLLGVLDFANLKNVDVIYRDLTGKPNEIWHLVKWVEEFRFLKNTPISISENATDLIPVETLVKTIWSDNGNFQVEFGKMLSGIDVEKVTNYASLNEWNFKKAFQASGYPAESSSGQLFEQYVASILVNLGISNTTCNAVRKTGFDKALSEIDIISNHLGKLTIIDCKMRSLDDENEGKVESLFDQIRKTYQLGKELGGLGATIILLRPNRTLSQNEQDLAASYRIQVFDAPRMVEIIDLLAKHFGVQQIPHNLIRVQNIIKETQKDQFYQGMGPAPFKNDWDLKTRSSGILNINSLLAKLQEDLHQDWAAFEIDSNIYIDFTIPKHFLNLREDNLRAKLSFKLHEMFSSFCEVQVLTVTKRKARCELRVFSGKIVNLRNLIKRKYGKPIL